MEVESKLHEAAEAYEDMVGKYSGLSKECAELKRREYRLLEKYAILYQKKQKALINAQVVVSEYRQRIKSLEDALKQATDKNNQIIKLRTIKAVILFFSSLLVIINNNK